MDAAELKVVLDKHRAWLNGLDGGERANMSGADLRDADMRCANMRLANMSHADMRGADMRGAIMRDADMRDADMSGANMSGADLRDADLRGVDMSGCKGLLDPIVYIKAYFERTTEGVIAYKTFGAHYEAPDHWKREPGAELQEVVNPDRATGCGCGINVAPLAWVKKQANGDRLDIWKCLIRWEWLPGVVVPFGTDGKIRCSRVQLLEIVT